MPSYGLYSTLYKPTKIWSFNSQRLYTALMFSTNIIRPFILRNDKIYLSSAAYNLHTASVKNSKA